MPQIDSNTIALLHFENEDPNVDDVIGNITWNVYTSNSNPIPIGYPNPVAVGNFLVNNNGDSPKFGNSFGAFAGTTTIYADSLTLGGHSFTIDCWALIPSSASINSHRLWAFDSTSYANVEGGSGNYRPHISSMATTTTQNCKDSIWHHIAYVYIYSIDTMMFFIDGVKYVELARNGESILVTPQTRKFTIGGENGQYNIFPGYIDEFHISNCARWIDNFTPPAEAWGSGSSPAPVADENAFLPSNYIHCYRNGTVYNIPLYEREQHPALLIKGNNKTYYSPLIYYSGQTNVSPVRIIKNGYTYALTHNEVN